MPQVDPNAVATAGIQDIQGAIDQLSALLEQPGADITGINKQIGVLQSKQTALRDQALAALVAAPATQAAIDALDSAATKLNTAAKNIGSVATAVQDALPVVNAATSLLTALAPFFV